MYKFVMVIFAVFLMTALTFGQGLFFSEYIEGSSNNKGLEIYNAGPDTANLDEYQIVQSANGGGWQYYHIFPAGAKLAPGDVWTMVTDQADTNLYNADIVDQVLAYPSVVHHTGNDARAIIKIAPGDTTFIDVFGYPDSSANFNVAGVTGAAAEHTLIRKSRVTTGTTDWAASAGTNATNSEWVVLPQNTMSLLGSFPVSVKVTFRANTSRIYGVTDTTGGVDLRGSMQGWAANSDPLNSDGGDYWSLEWTFPDTLIGTTQFYKYGVTLKFYLPPNQIVNYWENDAPGADGAASSPNREMTVPAASEMVMPVEYVGHRSPPFTPTDSIDVYFRINMAANADFQPESGSKVYLVGAFPNPDGSDNMWVPDKYPLTREDPTSDFWGFHLPLAAPHDSTMYRFTLGSWDASENVRGHGMFPDNENRGVTIGSNDTTLQWVWWNDVKFQGATGTDTVMVHFVVDMTRALQEKGFALDDTLLVGYGWNATAVQATDTLVNIPLTNRYEVTVEAQKVSAGKNLQYQYFRNSAIGDNREIFYDFENAGSDPRGAERRKLAIPTPAPQATMEVQDIELSETSMRRQPIFANRSLLTQNVTVYWECNLKPAYYQVAAGDTLEDGQGEINITPADKDSIFTWGVWMNGLAVGGWNNPAGSDWGPDLRLNLDKKMYDDGATEGDMTAGDSVYTLTWFYSPDSGDVVGQIYKFGLYGGDNEPGKGGFGLNHQANIDDGASTYTIHTQFGSINPFFYTAWDFDTESPIVSAVGDAGDGIVIRRPNLRENYPNPFNPSTTLTFELPKQMEVELTIFDVLGRKVNTLVKGVQRAGVHQVLWNGADAQGRSVSSGVYFYRLTTENYNRTLKMVLMR